ncbi:MAG: ABC transporter ATP-binding protein [Chloroflexi bacterium HGW-Chloroflexi-10]|nr:MAG: ABC transporter ATP-binding protein [Chloroflexi bacterium HGW-Chloroflexi-10]
MNALNALNSLDQKRVVITIQDAKRSFEMGDQRVNALAGVNLTIREGEFVALMGASGSGKSTLLNVIGCLDHLNSGEYWLEGEAVNRLSSDQLARIRNEHIGFIFQNFNLLPRLNAWENVALPLMYRKQVIDYRALACGMLEQVGLKKRMLHNPVQLSGGERQRVAIARALITNPAILLADEPTGNLDSVTGVEIMALLGDLSRQGRTILMVTHDAGIAAHAGRWLMMRDGKIIEENNNDVD